MDNGPAGQVQADGFRRGIAVIKPRDYGAAPLPEQKKGRILRLHGKGVLQASGRINGPGAAGKQITFQGKGPENINDHSEPPGRPGAFDQFQNLNLHRDTSQQTVPCRRRGTGWSQDTVYSLFVQKFLRIKNLRRPRISTGSSLYLL